MNAESSEADWTAVWNMIVLLMPSTISVQREVVGERGGDTHTQTYTDRHTHTHTHTHSRLKQIAT